MEESGEPHSEENKVSQEKSKKRKVKTRAQVEALEKFYSEHKYPTESMKLEVAERIGLTEKQVSGWFCHRRLKDRRLVREEAHGNGKQDRSSGVIQDRGSGLRQDSCGSTKQGDYRLLDPKEVESRSFYDEDLMPGELNYDQRRHFNEDFGGTDTSSSETSSPLQEKFFPSSDNPSAMEAKQYTTESTVPVNPNGVKGRRHIGPSGYLKVKGRVENAAITAVKSQLGRQYREDGPPLGIEFDPLPPGAFGWPVSDHINAELHNAGNSTLLDCSGVPGVGKQLNNNMRYEGIHSKMTSSASHMDEDNDMDGPDNWDDYSGRKTKQKMCFPNYSNSFASQNHSADMDENPIRETSSYSGSRKRRMRSQHQAEGMRLDSISDRNGYPYDGKVLSEQLEPWLDNDGNNSPDIVRQETSDYGPSNVLDRHNKFSIMEDARSSRRLPKEEKLLGQKRGIKDCRNPVDVRARSTKVANRSKVEFRQRDYLMNMPPLDMPLQNIKRSAVNVPPSFSEDETAETSSSMD